MKFKLGNYMVNVDPIVPDVGATYRHKDNDPDDMINHVVPQWVEDGQVRYAKFYKDPSHKTGFDTCPVAEFNKWFRKGD